MSVNMSSFFIILLFFIIGSCKARPEDQKVNDGKVEPRDEESLNVEGPTKENSIIEPNVPFFEGDIALPINSSSNQLGGVQGTYVINDAKIWPQGAVPFKIDTTSIVAKEHQDLIRQGLKELEEVATCLQFTEVTGELVGDVLLFRSHGDKKYPGRGCWSYVGRQGGTQVINLEPPECMDLEHIKHEVLHSLGATHEHSRPDRDKHIRILEENVLSGSLQNFKIFQWSYDDDVAGVENFGAPYDLYSIMHYPNNAFEILTRLEARAAQEILLEDTVENLEDTVEDLSLMKDTVENLEDTVENLSLMNMKRTCQEYADSGIKRSGYFWLDPDGPLNPPNQIRVWCNMKAESAVTEVLHDSEMTTNITHCPQPGCYTRNVTYESSRSQIRALMEISEHCSQDIRYDCTMAPMKIGFDNIDYAFWVGDNGKKNTHWDDFGNGTSSDDHFCACHSKSQCFRSNIDMNKCNCDSPMAIGKYDEGRITDIDILPVRQLRFGGLQFNFQSAQHTLGRLKCTGSKPVEIGSSCEALRIAGNYLSGYYNVKEGDQDVRLVFCNMTINPWDDSGLETFEESVAEEIEAVHTNFSTQLDHLEMAVNKTIQNVETTLRKMPGPPGKQGQKGNQGHVGPKGIKGDVGKIGSKGDKGNVGLQGNNGPKGEKGEIGQKGIRGMTGPSGLKGNKGAIGLTGNSGPKGDKGEIGTKGDKGNMGLQGIDGPKGDKGEIGQNGIRGMTGISGLKGNRGVIGLTGNSGPKGDKGEIGTKGEKGSKGSENLDHLTEMSRMNSEMLQLAENVELHNLDYPPLPPQPSVCRAYSTLSDAWRHVDYVNRAEFPHHCDQTGSGSHNTNLTLGTLWYRFVGAAGTKLPTGPAPVGGGPVYGGKLICGTGRIAHIASGGNPTIQDGIVSRDLCFEYDTDSCVYKGTVKVAACRDMNGDYFVYQLQPVPNCNLAYCAID